MSISNIKNSESYKTSITKTYEILKVNAINEYSSEFIVLLIKIWEKKEVFTEGERIFLDEDFNIKVHPIIEITSNGYIVDISNYFRSTWGAKVKFPSRGIHIGHSGVFDLKLEGLRRRGLASYIVSDIIIWAKSNSEYLNFNYHIHIKPFGETEEDKEGVRKFYSQFNIYSSSTDRSERIVSNLIEHRKEGKISLMLSLKDDPEDIFSHNLNQQIKSWFEQQYIQRRKIKILKDNLNRVTADRDTACGVILRIRKASCIFLAVSIVIIPIEYWFFKENNISILTTTLILVVGYLYILWTINQKYT